MIRLAAWLGVFAVLVRCAIAPGLMPDLAAAAHGSFQLVICTGAGVSVLQGKGDDGSQPANPQRDQIVCPYAAFGHLPIAADPVRLIISEFRAAFEAPTHGQICSPDPRRALGARAPPLST